MADKAFPIYFNWNDMMRKYLSPDERCILMDALADFYENGVDPIPKVPEELRFALALMIDCINVKRNRSAEMAERGRAGAQKRYAADDDDEPKQSNSSAMAEPKQSNSHYNNNNNNNENNIAPSNEGVAPARKKRFVPPTVDEVANYAREKGLTFDAEEFVDYYANKQWRIGGSRTQMSDWRAAARNWAKKEWRDKPKSKERNSESYKTDEFFAAATERSYDAEIVAGLKKMVGVTA